MDSQIAIEAAPVLERYRCGWVRVNSDGRITKSNSLFQEWVGLDDKGREWNDVLEKSSRIFWAANTEPVLQQGGHVDDVSITLSTPDGPMPVLMNVTPEEDGFSGLLYPNDDRQAYQRQQQELARVRMEADMLGDMAKLRQEFVRAASHQLATPLTSAKINLQALRASATDAMLPMIEGMQRSFDRQERFIRQLTRLQELQALSPEDFSLFSLDQLLRDATHEGNANVHLAGDQDAHALGNVDASMVALKEVLSNAKKFGDGQEITATMKAEPPSITITNAGRGVAAEDLERIGAPFVQSKEATAMTNLGMGLGLHIAQLAMASQRAKLHWTSSGIDQGFTVHLEWNPM